MTFFLSLGLLVISVVIFLISNVTRKKLLEPRLSFPFKQVRFLTARACKIRIVYTNGVTFLSLVTKHFIKKKEAEDSMATLLVYIMFAMVILAVCSATLL